MYFQFIISYDLLSLYLFYVLYSSNFLDNQIAPEVDEYLKRFHLWDFDLLAMRQNNMIDNPVVVCVMTALSVNTIYSTII
jgi:hypothetical protein